MTALLRTWALISPLALRLALGRRRKAGKEHPIRWPERLGRPSVERPPGRLAWLHGASVGEGLSMLPLLEALRTEAPELGLLVTTGTTTSAELLPPRLPAGAAHQFAPLDTPGVARAFLDHWRPDVAVFVESEAWPNLLGELRRRRTPTALVSARLSEKSAQGWLGRPASARSLFGGFDVVLAQDDAGAARLKRLGARDDGRLNLKVHGAPLAADRALVREADRALAGRPVLIAASTHPGEDEAVLAAFKALEASEALLIIVPRHPERGGEVAALAEAAGFTPGLRSAGDALDGRARVYVADTLGELGSWFALASARGVFVGGSLVEGPGGHNPLEPIRQGLAVVTGPHVDNWRSVYQQVGEAVFTAETSGSLKACFEFLLSETERPSPWALAAARTLNASRGELPEVARRLLALAERPR